MFKYMRLGKATGFLTFIFFMIGILGVAKILDVIPGAHEYLITSDWATVVGLSIVLAVSAILAAFVTGLLSRGESQDNAVVPDGDE